MAYQVLARKYRPQRFSDVAGQEHVTRTLRNALAQGRIAHGYIFSGHRGIGKTTIARILAMGLNCRTAIGAAGRPDPEPCGSCDSCREIRASASLDMIEIDAATNRGIDEIRELRDAARYSPARDRYKVYLLDEAHQITDAAFNALLKILEEPPAHVVFMMATTQPEDIPQTIRSRCQHFSFHAVQYEDILAQLTEVAREESIDVEPGALALLSEAGDGSMRDALSIMDQAIAGAPTPDGRPRIAAADILALLGSVPNAAFERLLEFIAEGGSAAVMEELDRLLSAGNSPLQLARQMVRYLRNCLMARIGGENTGLLQISADEKARAQRTAALYSEEDLTRFLQVMLRTFDELNYRQEPRLHLELGLLKLVHLQRLIPLEEILSSLPGVAGPQAPSPRPDSGRARADRGQDAVASPGSLTGSLTGPLTGPLTGSLTGPFTGPSPENPRHLLSGHLSQPVSPPFPPPDARPADAPESGRSSAFADHLRPASAAVAQAPDSPASSAAPESMKSVELTDSTDSMERGGGDRYEEQQTWIRLRPIDSIGASTGASIGGPITDEPKTGPTRGSMQDQGPMQGPDGQADAADKIDLAGLRERVCAALEEQGHHTPAGLLAAGQWRMQDAGAIQVEIGVKKSLLGLVMSAETWKIVREALRTAGATEKMTVIPGEASGDKPASAPPRSAGSNRSEALNHPLVLQAQEIFRAEVRSVMDLRETSRRD